MQDEHGAGSGRRRKAGSVLIVLSGLLLLGSATAKVAQLSPVVAQMGANGFAGWRLQVVALLEIAGAMLWLVPVTRSAGLLFVSAFLGGAVATHMGHAEPIFGPAVVLTVVWLGAWLRHPEILWSLRRRGEDAFSSTDSKTPIDGLLRQI